MDPENEDLDQMQYDFPSNMSILCIYPEFNVVFIHFFGFQNIKHVFFHHPPQKKAPKSIDHQNIGRHHWAAQVPSLGKPPEVRRASLEPQHGS